MVNYTPRTWVSGETVTAAEMNAEIRDPWTGIQAAWTAYTPAWASTGTAPAIGNGSVTGAYMRVGKTLMYVIVTSVGSTTTVGTGTYTWSLPFAISGSFGRAAGTGGLFDASAGLDLTRAVTVVTTTTVALTDAAGARVGATVPVVPATGDAFSLSGMVWLA